MATPKAKRAGLSKAAIARIPYRTGAYRTITEVSLEHGFLTRKELEKKVQRRTRKTMQRVRFDVNVVLNPNHRSNRGTDKVVNKKGEVKVKVLPKTATATS